MFTNRLRKLGLVPVIVAAAAAMALLLVVVQSGTTSAQSNPGTKDPVITNPTPVPPTLVYTCYDVQKGEDVKVEARLITKNFGGDLVTVRRLVMMCELSTKNVLDTPHPEAPPVQSTKIYACYTLDRGTDPNDPYSITTKNFGKDVVMVRTSNLMCETASKTVTNAAGGTQVYGSPSGGIWQCYRLDKGLDPNKAFILKNNNFGANTVRVRTGFEMCEEGEKDRIINGMLDISGQANGVVYECFKLENGNDPQKVVTLETKNFGKDQVVVRNARAMCEIGVKEPIHTTTATGIDIPLPD